MFGLPWWLSGKESTCNAGDTRDTASIPELGRPPGGGHGSPLSILAWRIPWTEEPGGLQSMGSQRDGHDLVTKQPKQQPSFQIYFSQISDTKFSKIGRWKTIFSSH